jgi:hypothetical protein
MSKANAFITTFLICAGLSIAALGLFNVIMDPYDYFETSSTIVAVNNKKLSHDISERLKVAVEVIKSKPQAILLGSSRVRAGFDNNYFGNLVNQKSQKVAFSGARFEEIFGYFEHALANQPNLKEVFLGVDFFAFAESLKPVEEYSKERLGKPFLPLNDVFKLVFSKHVLHSSYQTLKFNLDPIGYEYLDRYHVKLDDGIYITISQSMLEKPDEYLKIDKKLFIGNYQIDPYKVSLFKKMVDLCHEKNINLKVVFLPTHSVYAEMLCQCGAWEQFEKLKHTLVSICPIYDFSGFTSYNSESLPTADQDFANFFEISHFKPSYGKIILDKVYGKNDCCSDTGILLTEKNVEKSLIKMRKQHLNWQNHYLEWVEWVKNVNAENKNN